MNRPQPILTRAAISSGVATILTLLIVFGVPLSPAQQDAITQTVALIGPWAVALVVWWWSHRKVTPLSDPRNDQGQRLVPDGERIRRARPTESGE